MTDKPVVWQLLTIDINFDIFDNVINNEFMFKGSAFMNRQQLEMFLSLSKSLNFTKTASEFYTSQPTISRQIVLLEEEWGINLFVRNKREVRLTPSGAIMYEKCIESLKIIDDGIAKCNDISNGTTGNLRLGILETMDTSIFVMPIASYFNSLFPNIHLNIEKRSFRELREKLESGYIDIVFTLDFDIKGISNLAYDKFCDVTAGIVVSKNSPLAKKEHLDPEDFIDETFLLPCPSDCPGRKEELENILKNLGIKYKGMEYRDNAESVTLNIRSGKGVALLDTSISVVSDESHYTFFPLPKEIAPLSVVYAWKKDNTNPAMAQFINTLFTRENIDVFFN